MRLLQAHEFLFARALLGAKIVTTSSVRVNMIDNGIIKAAGK